VIFCTFLVLALVLASLTQYVSEQQTAEPLSAHDAATNQEANETTFLACSTSFVLGLSLLLTLFLATPLAEKVGEK
jgi:hypothetical protein